MKQYIAGLKNEENFKSASETLLENGAKNIRQHDFMKTLVYFDSKIDKLGGVPVTEYSDEDIKGISDGEETVGLNADNLDWGLGKTVQGTVGVSSATAALSAINVTGAHKYKGAGVDVYVVDTGVAQHSTLPKVNAVGSHPWEDDNGHGTHVAGTICSSEYGIAHNATLYAVKVLEVDGSGTISQIVDGIGAIVNHRRTQRAGKPAVVNFSVSAVQKKFNPITEAVTYLVNSGAIVIAAAGNEGKHLDSITEIVPAEAPNVITVGATDNRKKIAPFSNYSKDIEISAPGVGIISTWPGETKAVLSGTSMACPHVAGVLAAWLETRTSQMNTLDDVREVVGSFLTNGTTQTVDTGGKDHNNRFLDASKLLYETEVPIQDVPKEEIPINMPEEEYKTSSGFSFEKNKILIGVGVAALLAAIGFFIFLQL